MSLLAAAQSKPSTWPVAVGAEGITAAQFARCGFDVLVQAGHDKPSYDLVVTKAGNLLKVSIKGSDDGRWCLTQSYLTRTANPRGIKSDTHRAIDLWLDIHGSRTVYCLVQFEGVSLHQLPRIYLASPSEIASRMRQNTERLGDSALREQYEWISPESGMRALEALPSSWLFSQERIQELLTPHAPQAMVPRSHSPVAVWATGADSKHQNGREIALTA
jgi:hypothetical protein